MSITRRAAVLAVLGAAVVPPAALAARTDEVLVVNGPDRPVPASIVGTPSVALAGTPSVSLAGTPSVGIAGTPTVAIDPAANVVRVEEAGAPAGPAPFQQLLTFAPEPDDDEFCHTVKAPAGTVITVQRVTATVNSPVGTSVRLSYLPGVNNGRRFLERLIEEGAGTTSDSTETLLHLGLGEPSLVLQACLENTSGHRRTADVVVSGTQQPA